MFRPSTSVNSIGVTLYLSTVLVAQWSQRVDWVKLKEKKKKKNSYFDSVEDGVPKHSVLNGNANDRAQQPWKVFTRNKTKTEGHLSASRTGLNSDTCNNKISKVAKPISYNQATKKTSDPKNIISNNPDIMANKVIYKPKITARPKTTPVTVGTELSGERRAWFHLGKVKAGTSVEDVENFLKTKFTENQDLIVEKLYKRS